MPWRIDPRSVSRLLTEMKWPLGLARSSPQSVRGREREEGRERDIAPTEFEEVLSISTINLADIGEGGEGNELSLPSFKFNLWWLRKLGQTWRFYAISTCRVTMKHRIFFLAQHGMMSKDEAQNWDSDCSSFWRFLIEVDIHIWIP